MMSETKKKFKWLMSLLLVFAAIGLIVVVVLTALKPSESTVSDDIDECRDGTKKCSSNSRCINTPGSYSCSCVDGYDGNGESCNDIDECKRRPQPCDLNAACTNTDGSYSCMCNGGFRGDGTSCVDYDECKAGHHDCHKKAKCINTWGSYECCCSNGYHGNGKVCKASTATSLLPSVILPMSCFIILLSTW